MHNSSFNRRALLGTVLLGTLALAVPASAATPAETFVSTVGNSVIEAARNGSQDNFRSVLRSNADLETIAVFSLGSYRKNLDAGRKAEYINLVETYISRVFSENAARLAGESLEVTSSQEAADSVIVKSQLNFADGRSVAVTWRLVKRGGGYKIFDVNVDGIWLATTQKTNFVSVLNQNNGDIGALLTYLKQ